MFLQTCSELGFSFTTSEWNRIHRLLGDGDLVRNADFFSALTRIMGSRKSNNNAKNKDKESKDGKDKYKVRGKIDLLQNCNAKTKLQREQRRQRQVQGESPI